MWQQADHFHIPLLNGLVSVGQVIELTGRPDNAALCALTRRNRLSGHDSTPLSLPEIISLQVIVPPEDIQQHWPITGFEQIPRIRDIFDLNHHKIMEFADLEARDPAIIEAFVNAYHGLYPWDGFPDPNFFAGLLLDPKTLPTSIKTRTEME